MRRTFWLVLAALFVVAACDEEHIDPIGAGGNGDTGFRVLLVDDPAIDPDVGGGGNSVFTGVLEGGASVALRNQAGALIDLGSSEDFTLELQDGDAAVAISETRPPAGTYVAVQLSLESASALIPAGSTIGGAIVEDDTSIDVGPAGLVVIERSIIPAVISNDTQRELVLDLNAETWITAANLADGLVDEDELGNSVAVIGL